MATGRIGVTPTLGVRWSKAPASGTTSLSGLDDNSVSLVYSVGYEQVYRNGVLLSRGNDYTATNGTTVTLTDATVTGDIIEIFANELVPLTDAISKGQFTAKGSLLSASAASTPAVLAVGSNDQVLTADSSTATGLKWATPSSGGMTLLSTTTFDNTVVTYTISSISGSYTNLRIIGTNLQSGGSSSTDTIRFRFNGDTGNNYNYAGNANAAGTPTGIGSRQSSVLFASGGSAITVLGQTGDASGDFGYFDMTVFDYASSTERKNAVFIGGSNSGFSARHYTFTGLWDSTSAITSLTFFATNNLKAGVVRIYGEK